MKRSDSFSVAAAAVILAAIAVYAAANFLSPDKIYYTAEAVSLTLRDSVCVSGGIIVRDESTFDGGEGVTVIMAADGERVPSGSVVAMSGSAVTAGQAGIFYSFCDGYEHLSSSDLAGLTPERLSVMKAGRQSFSASCPGKLICSDTWYFAAALPSGKRELFSAGEYVELCIDGQTFPAFVYSAGEPVRGQFALVLSSETGVAYTLGERTADAVLSAASYTGLCVPYSALIKDINGRYCVFTVIGGQARLVYTQLVYCGDDYFLVSPSAELASGSPVVTNPSGLHDGEVISTSSKAGS